jgi:hypothetical protein
MRCDPRRIVAALTLVGLALVSSIEANGQVVPGQKKRASRQKTHTEAEPRATGPMEVFSEIERGWNANKVDLILKHFGESKVSIAVEAGPTGGKFSRSQSYYLLKDLFKYTITKKFEFVQYRRPSKNGKTSFAVAERVYQKSDDGRLFKDKIYVSLHMEKGGQWVVNEIKSIR